MCSSDLALVDYAVEDLSPEALGSVNLFDPEAVQRVLYALIEKVMGLCRERAHFASVLRPVEKADETVASELKRLLKRVRRKTCRTASIYR